MPDLTADQREAMAEAANRARRYLAERYPVQQAGWLMCAMLAATFADMLTRTHPDAQRALADALNDRLAGTPWRVVQHAN